MLRAPEWAGGRAPVRIFTTGFCFGGRLTFLSGTLGLEMAGVIGFYGWPTGPVTQRHTRAGRRGFRDRLTGPRHLGRRRPGDRPAAVEEFEAALGAAGVEHRSITYPGAPHSFFDRTAVEHAEASAAAWAEVLAFIRAHPG